MLLKLPSLYVSNVNFNGDRAPDITRVTRPTAARTARTNFKPYSFEKELDFTLRSFQI